MCHVSDCACRIYGHIVFLLCGMCMWDMRAVCDICLMCVSEVYVQHQEWCMCCVHIMCFRCVECVWCMGVVCELYLSFLVCVVSVCGRSVVNMCGVYVLYMYGLDMVYVCLCGVCVVKLC